MAEDRVGDDELLYRRIEYQGQGYQPRSGVAPRISSQAFSDRKMEPSVDRANLVAGPEWTRGADENGVVRLLTGDIREINAVAQTLKNMTIEFIYKFDVIPVPLDEHAGHAEVHPSPAYRSKGRFRKLLEQLAWLAEWETLPGDCRS